MYRTPSLRSTTKGGALAVGLAAVVGTSLLASSPAMAAPKPVPKGVRIQCGGFSGPNATFPHFLTDCTRRNGTTGTGQSNRTAPGTETITWDAPFVKGKSMPLTNITNSPVSPPSGACPADHPGEVNVSGVIGGTKWAGSPVTATICANANDFLLKPGTYFVIGKTPKDADIDDFNDEP
ncbi:hypothetical protein MMAD_55660 (plasmid) [Mycolicibacterium madagascariense]|uniref:Secreted protein n=1 Tax=Mycolicibacterium madagascariense TaxID=212765 RepID=A0A7I7XPV3_9MYCO|nr:hypothetical protein [Mycolicibacterium madagascariense]BBZ31271.1 hypothetical protein MMAD_55660 [Mycolicibacterium madagascariense]